MIKYFTLIIFFSFGIVITSHIANTEIIQGDSASIANQTSPDRSSSITDENNEILCEDVKGYLC